MTENFPTLSLTERDRRFNRTRQFLRDQGLDALLLYGLKSRERYEAYLAGTGFDGLVLFPASGEPIALTWASHRITTVLEAAARGMKRWIPDFRQMSVAPDLVEVIKSSGLSKSRLGVFGHSTKGPAEIEGIISYTHWSAVIKALPEAIFVDVTDAYSAVMLVKSEEELAMVRKSAAIGESACKRMFEATAAGATSHEIAAAVMHEIFSCGAVNCVPPFILSIGSEDVSWSPVFWGNTGGAPQVVKSGDVVQAEIFPVYGGFETQQQMAIAVGPLAREHAELADIARRAYEAGLKVLKPGISFKQLNDAMYAPLKETGCWHLTPLLHSLAPLCLTGQVGIGLETWPGYVPATRMRGRQVDRGDFVIEAGTVFEFEPNACRGSRRINVGGTVIVTRNGVEELNSIPTRLTRKP